MQAGLLCKDAAQPHKPKQFNLGQLVADEVRNAILQGTMHPGEHLCQHMLARSYATSRAPVREALVQLHAEGLLRHDLHRGYFVKRFSWDDVGQLYKLRRWLEGELLSSLRWPEPVLLDDIVRLQADLERARKHSGREIAQETARLRSLLFGLSAEQVLLREAGRLWARLDRLHAYFLTEGTYAFSEALRLRDRTLLLDFHSRERDEAERLLADAQSALPGIWSNAA